MMIHSLISVNRRNNRAWRSRRGPSWSFTYIGNAP